MLLWNGSSILEEYLSSEAAAERICGGFFGVNWSHLQVCFVLSVVDFTKNETNSCKFLRLLNTQLASIIIRFPDHTTETSLIVSASTLILLQIGQVTIYSIFYHLRHHLLPPQLIIKPKVSDK
jgi:hypothetical protein